MKESYCITPGWPQAVFTIADYKMQEALLKCY